MNRKIAFRVWDKKDKLWVAGWSIGQAGVQTETSNKVFMQYTGLQDKNGKEIYEGDVMPIVIENLGESIKTVNGVVKFEQGQWNIEYLHPFQKEIYLANLYSLLERAEKEVIGNIYENPELLNK